MRLRHSCVAVLLVAASCGGSSAASSPPVLVVSSGSQNLAASDALSAESKIARPWDLNFVSKADLPLLDSKAASYRMSPGSFTSEDVAALGEVLGVKGTVVESSDGPGGSYTIGSQDTNSLWVSNDAGGFWSFSSFSGAVSSSCASSDKLSPCLEPTYPRNVPSEKEARALFERFLGSLGLDYEDFVIEGFSDSWGATFFGFLKVDGVRTSLSVSASYGSNGDLSWASGFLGKIESAAEYPRIGTTAALERLNKEQFSPLLRSSSEDTDVPEVATVDPVDPLTTPDTSQQSYDTAVDQPVSPEVRDVLIVKVEQELVSLFGTDGSVYLVPGYAFLPEMDSNGFQPRYVVSALPDEFVKTEPSQPPVPDVLPPATSSGSGQSGGADVPVDGDASVLIGLSEDAANITAKERGWVVRVVSRDGEDFIVTQDFSTNRVNLTVTAGKVVKASIG